MLTGQVPFDSSNGVVYIWIGSKAADKAIAAQTVARDHLRGVRSQLRPPHTQLPSLPSVLLPSLPPLLLLPVSLGQALP